MTSVAFIISFHSAFRVGTAFGRDGLDVVSDPDTPLPSDHVKGCMRDAAAKLAVLRYVPEGLVAAVFGSQGSGPSPWTWGCVDPVDSRVWESALRHRVSLDEQTGAALRDHLVAGEQVYVPQARFEVIRTGRISEQERARHQALLRLSARMVHGLGAWRRRGLGWVDIRPEADQALDHDFELVAAGEGSPR